MGFISKMKILGHSIIKMEESSSLASPSTTA